MKLLLSIAFRNLFRQKSRTILLGLGIGLGVMVLTIGFSFSKGISRNVIDKIVQSNIFGHLGMYEVEKEGKTSRTIIRDKAEMITRITTRLDHVKEVREALTIGVYAIGNGFQTPMGLAGIDLSVPNVFKATRLVEGDFDNFTNHKVENPLILEYQRAKVLNVKVGDKVRIRTRTIYGQIQTAELNLVATYENEAPIINMFFQGGVPLLAFKKIMGYQPHEASRLNIIMEDMGDTANILKLADTLHQRLEPELVNISGIFQVGNDTIEGVVYGIQSGQDAVDKLKQNIIKGNVASFAGRSGRILIAKSIAEKLGLDPGTDVNFSYKPRFEKAPVDLKYEVGAIIEDIEAPSNSVAFVNDMDFYKTYLNHLPAVPETASEQMLLSKDHPLYSSLCLSWKRAQRTYTQDAMNKKRRKIRRMDYQGRILDVISMKEPAGDLYTTEAAINIMSLFGMGIVFSIILLGVLNTVRMNIRERTTEIGTVRAVGMQARQVLFTSIAEVGLLALFAALLGVIAGYICMDLFSMMTFHPKDLTFSAFLDEGHMKFIPNIGAIVFSVVAIIFATMACAFFPARRAAQDVGGKSIRTS